MPLNNLKQSNNLKDYILGLGIDLVGLASLGDYNLYYERLQNKKALFYGQVKTKQYVDLTTKVTNPKLIISIGVSYHQTKIIHLDKYEATYSKISYGPDYHDYLYQKIALIIKYLQAIKPDLNYYVNVDNRDLDDRFFAYQCGLGFYGKNSMLINPVFGSEVVYGTIVCDLDLTFEKSSLLESKCGSCNKCQQACPTNSLHNEYSLDFSNCLSYLSQSKQIYKADTSNRYLYGCDRCNDACPFNIKAPPTKYFIDSNPKINIFELLNFTKKEYQAYFKNKSLGWLNYNIIKKNAILLLNYEDEIVKEFIDSYHNESALINEAIKYLKGSD